MADALRGRAYQDGLSGRQDYAEAARLYRRAAVRGLSLGQYYLGFLYVAGLGVHQDYAEAVRWLRAAGEQGDADAQSCSASCTIMAKESSEITRTRFTGFDSRRSKDVLTLSTVSG